MSDEAAVKDPPDAPVAPAAEAPAEKPSAEAAPKPAPKPAAAKKAKAKKPAGKDKDKDKDEKKKGKQEPSGASVAGHPRASAQVRLAKGWGGLGGFGIAAYLSLRAGVPPELAALRAIAAGALGYMLGWGCTVMVWRHLVAAELRALAERRRKRAEEEQLASAAKKPASKSDSGT